MKDRQDTPTAGISKAVEMLSRFEKASAQTPKSLGNELFIFESTVRGVIGLAARPGDVPANAVTEVVAQLQEAYTAVFKPEGLGEVWCRTNQRSIRKEDLPGPAWLKMRFLAGAPESTMTFEDWLFPKREEKRPFLTTAELETYKDSWMKPYVVGFKEIADNAIETLKKKFPEYEASKQKQMIEGFRWILYQAVIIDSPTFKPYKDLDPWTANMFTVLRHINYMRMGHWSQQVGNSVVEDKNLNLILTEEKEVQKIKDMKHLSGYEKAVKLEELSKARELVRAESFSATGKIGVDTKGRWSTEDQYAKVGLLNHLLSRADIAPVQTAEIIMRTKAQPETVALETTLPMAKSRDDLKIQKKVDKVGNVPPRVKGLLKGHYADSEFTELAEYLAGKNLSADQIMIGILLHDFTPAYAGDLEINFSESEED